jgi:PAS domain S-box-containing protein
MESVREPWTEASQASLVAAAPLPISVMTPEGRRIDANRAAERLFKRSREEIVGLKTEELYSKEDVSKIEEALEECKRIGSSSCEVTAIGGDNTTFPAVLDFAPVKDKEGNIIDVLATATDVTELKEKERQIEDARAYNEHIIAHIADGLYVVDNDGNWLTTNPAMAGITGYSEEELLSRKTLDQPFLQLPEAKEAIRKMWQRVNAGEIVTGVEIPWIRKDGKKIIISGSEQLLKDAEGNDIGRVFVARDATEEYEREEELKKKEEHQTHILRCFPDPLAIIDEENRWVDVNDGWIRVLGYSKDEILDKKSAELPLILPEARRGLEERTKEKVEKLERGERIFFKSTFRAKDGRSVNVLISEGYLPVTGERLITARDITELRERETKLKNATSTFGIIMRKVAIGDLLARVELDAIDEKYLAIGEDLNSMIDAISEHEAELESAKLYLNAVMDSIDVPLFTFDRDARLTYVDPEFENTFGYSKDEVLGLFIEDFAAKILPPEAVPIISKRVRERVKTGEIVRNIPVDLVTKDGKIIPCLYSSAGIMDVKGDVVGTVVALSDVTELRKREEELKQAVNTFGDVLSKTASGNLLARVELNAIDEDYRPIGEDINSMVEAVERNIEEIKNSRETLSRLIEENPVPILIADEDLNILEVNRSYLALTGYSKENIVSKNMRSDFNVIETIERVNLGEAMEKGEKTAGMNVVDTPNGRFTFIVGALPYEDVSTGEKRLLMTFMDITELKEKEREIEDAKTFSDQIIDTVADCLCVVDNEGRWIRANQAWERFLEYKSEELLGKKTEEQPFMMEKTLKIVKEELWGPLYEKKIISNVELPLIHKNGEVVVMLASEGLLKDAEGNNIGRLFVASDITE